MAKSKAATSSKQLQPPTRTAKGTAKSWGKAPPVKSSSSWKWQTTVGTYDEESSDGESPPPLCHCKKEKQSWKVNKEVNDDHEEPEIEVVEEEDVINGEPIEIRDSDKVLGHYCQVYIQCSHQ